jgi:1-acyl-sn-glycerol-3-phosphate acyltransferase
MAWEAGLSDIVPPPLARPYSARAGTLAELVGIGWESLRFYPVLAAFGLLCLAWSLPAGVLRRVLPLPQQRRLGRWGIATGFRWYLALMRLAGLARFDLSALDRLREEGGVVIVANHRSLIDAVLLLSRLPRVACISKASLWRRPMLSGGMALAGYLRNDSPHELVRAAIATLRRGEPLLVFPEGTRGSGRSVGEFRRGFAIMAQAVGAPVQTVFLESNTTFLHKGWPCLRRPDFPLLYRARLGRRFEIASDPDRASAELEAYFRAELDAP